METKLIYTKNYLLLIDEEAEIKENTNTFKEGFNGDWFWNSKYNSIQRIGDITEFDFKIIAYYPLNSEAEELDLPLLPNPFEEVDVEELACKKYNIKEGINDYDERYYNSHNVAKAEAFIEGYKAAQAKQFSLEDIEKVIHIMAENYTKPISKRIGKTEIIQSLSTQQLPKEFIVSRIWENAKGEKGKRFADVALQCEDGEFDAWLVNETTTNPEGKEELVGTYKY